MIRGADAGSWIDPDIFSVGFALAFSGVMLSQWICDYVDADARMELQRRPNSVIFGLTRKVTALAIIIAAVLGFWIVGWWWIIVGIVMAYLGGAMVNAALRGTRIVGSMYVLCHTGIILLT